MANIVGINDSRPKKSESSGGEADQSDVNNPFLMTGPIKDPRDESFPETIHINFFPNLKWHSFSLILIYILVIMFIIQICVDRITEDPSLLQKYFLPVKITGPVSRNFVADYIGIKQRYEVWKFVTSLFIHQNAQFLLSSVLSLLIWTSMFERIVKWPRLLIYFILGGILGNIYGLAIVGTGFSFGPTPGIFGIFGGVLGYLFYNWRNMENVDGRGMWIFLIVFIFLINIIFSDMDSLVYSVTGFVAGVFIGFCFSEKYLQKGTIDFGRTSHENVFFVTGIVTLVVLTLILTLVLFLVTRQSPVKPRIEV